MTDTWTAPQADRTEPDLVADERNSLEQWLDYQRATLLQKCAGLTSDELKQRSVPPSRLSLLGLVRHMVEVERWWFRMHAAGQDLPFVYDPDWEGLDFEALEDADARADLETYIKECEASRAATAGHSLDETVASRRGDSGQVRDIRWIYVHMIEEYARHNGHADLLREAIDGATGD